MSTGTVLAIAIPALVVLGGALAFVTSRRRGDDVATGVLSRDTVKRDRGVTPVALAQAAPTGREVERQAALSRTGTAVAVVEPTTPVAWVAPDREQIGMARRQFLNRGIITMMGVSLSGFGVSLIAFLWPKLGGGFGSDIRLGSVQEVETNLNANKGFAYYPAGRLYITRYPADALNKAKSVYNGGVLAGMSQGYVALYQKCPHLGCRVPQCDTSQWFECPCHGSQYNRVGEKKAGPAPRGMDRFALKVGADGSLVVSTGQKSDGPPIGTNTTGQEIEGPHCTSVAEKK